MLQAVKYGTEATLWYKNGNIMQTLMEGIGEMNTNINSVCVCVCHRQWVGKYGKIKEKDFCRHFWT